MGSLIAIIVEPHSIIVVLQSSILILLMKFLARVPKVMERGLKIHRVKN